MIGKILFGIGLGIDIVSGVFYLAVVNAVQMAQTSYGPTVQDYARNNEAIGMPLISGILVIGTGLALLGLVMALVQRGEQITKDVL